MHTRDAAYQAKKEDYDLFVREITRTIQRLRSETIAFHDIDKKAPEVEKVKSGHWDGRRQERRMETDMKEREVAAKLDMMKSRKEWFVDTQAQYHTDNAADNQEICRLQAKIREEEMRKEDAAKKRRERMEEWERVRVQKEKVEKMNADRVRRNGEQKAKARAWTEDYDREVAEWRKKKNEKLEIERAEKGRTERKRAEKAEEELAERNKSRER